MISELGIGMGGKVIEKFVGILPSVLQVCCKAIVVRVTFIDGSRKVAWENWCNTSNIVGGCGG
jgi:hypothetical protein